MSSRNRIYPIDENEENEESDKHQSGQRLPKKPSSPLMFDDDMISVYSGLNHSFEFSQLKTNQKSPSQWKEISRIPSNESNSPLVLSMSQIERVSTCRICDDEADCLNESTDYHNRSVADFAQISMNSDVSSDASHAVVGFAPKRVRFSEASEVDPSIPSFSHLKLTETFDIAKKINDQDKVITDQIASLHEDW